MDKTNLFAIFVAFLLIALIVWAIYKQVREHYMQDDPMLNKIRSKLEKFYSEHYMSNGSNPQGDERWHGLLETLNHRDIMGETNLYRGNKSYTINKAKVYICLKDEKGEYFPENFLLYVTLHEHAHVLCDEIGHTDKFHKIFQALLVEAAKAGIYDPNQEILQNYCENGDSEVEP